MFLGTYTPKLDDKGRLTLPAKFRDALAGGLMVARAKTTALPSTRVPSSSSWPGGRQGRPESNPEARAVPAQPRRRNR